MKWFKHMTGTADDEKISRLLDIAGLEGYGFYWRIIEIIAGQIGKDSEKYEVTYSLPALVRLTYSHHNKVGNLLGKLQVTGLIDVSKTELDGRVNFTLRCRNILKYRDEWTSRSGKTRESLGSNSGETPEEIQIQKQIQKKDNKREITSFPKSLDDEQFRKSWDEWKQYRKERRKPLTATGEQKSLNALVPFGKEWAIERINKAIAAGWQGLVFDSDKSETVVVKPKLPPGQIQVVL